MENLRERASKAGIDLIPLHTNAMKIAEAFAGSGGPNVKATTVVELYNEMIIAQLKVFEAGKK